jgi:Leucine-rich repeat (LRR) protein
LLQVALSHLQFFILQHNLKKLYLDNNDISRLEGLANCHQLEELYLCNQRRHLQQVGGDASSAPSEPMSFEPESLQAIAGSLKVLHLSNSHVHGY